MNQNETFHLIEFPGYINDNEESLNKALDCYGGESEIKEFATKEDHSLSLHLRPEDKCSSGIQSKTKLVNNKLILTITPSGVVYEGKVKKECKVDSLSPFQVLKRCSLFMLMPDEQKINQPFEINTSRMTKVNQPTSVNLNSKEREVFYSESHPFSLTFRKTKNSKKDGQGGTQLNSEVNND